MNKKAVTPKIGLLPTGHKIYWQQYPRLRSMGESMYNTLLDKLTQIGNVIAADMADDVESAQKAAELFSQNDIDILLIFPLDIPLV